MITLRKKIKLGKSLLKSKIHPLPIWVHLWVTDHCNLSCDYCYVVNAKLPEPTAETVKSWIVHADELGSAIIAFMGGEPTLREDLTDLIAAADERNIITYMTTNGKLLTYEKITEFARSGLDYLELSLDGYDSVDCSQKTLNGNESLIDILEQAAKESRIRCKIHQVLAPSTLAETQKLLELSERIGIPISFGLVNYNSGELINKPEDNARLKEILDFLLQRRNNRTTIINPAKYFEDAIASLDRRVRISCDVGQYMIQVATDGSVYLCSKLTTKRLIKFLDIDQKYFEEDQHGSRQLLERCSDKCLSACAYTASFLRQHYLSLISTYCRFSIR